MYLVNNVNNVSWLHAKPSLLSTILIPDCTLWVEHGRSLVVGFSRLCFAVFLNICHSTCFGDCLLFVKSQAFPQYSTVFCIVFSRSWMDQSYLLFCCWISVQYKRRVCLLCNWCIVCVKMSTGHCPGMHCSPSQTLNIRFTVTTRGLIRYWSIGQLENLSANRLHAQPGADQVSWGVSSLCLSAPRWSPPSARAPSSSSSSSSHSLAL